MVKYQKTIIALGGLLLPLAASMQIAQSQSSATGGCNPTSTNRPICSSGASLETATFIDPTVEIAAPENITLEPQVYIGPFAQLQASTNASITIGKQSNAQDNVKIYAQFQRNSAAQQKVTALGIQGVEIGERVIMAHGASVKGPAQIGVQGSPISADPNTDAGIFLSFGAEVDGAILETNTGVEALGRVGPGVRLKSGFFVLPGKNVTTQAEAEDPALGKVRLISEADFSFNEGVLEVNKAFAREYIRLAQEDLSNVQGINYDPGNTTFNSERNLPKLAGASTRDPNFRNRIIGDINLADSRSRIDTVMGNRISLRADEGHPFTIGSLNSMQDDVIFHALKEHRITIGKNVVFGTGAIVHGGAQRFQNPSGKSFDVETSIGNNVTLKNQSLVFRSTVGNGSTIGVKSAVINSELQPNTAIADRVIYLNNAVFSNVEW